MTVNNIETLLELLALHGGRIVSTASLDAELIEQARSSGRMYVDNDSLGYVWEPEQKAKISMGYLRDLIRLYDLEKISLSKFLEMLNNPVKTNDTLVALFDAIKNKTTDSFKAETYSADELLKQIERGCIEGFDNKGRGLVNIANLKEWCELMASKEITK